MVIYNVSMYSSFAVQNLSSENDMSRDQWFWVLGSEIILLVFNIMPPLPLGSEVHMIYSYNTPDLGFGL